MVEIAFLLSEWLDSELIRSIDFEYSRHKQLSRKSGSTPHHISGTRLLKKKQGSKIKKFKLDFLTNIN